MPHSRRGTRHHCPGHYGKVDNYPGNCRHNGLWCETHENYCAKHDWSFMKKWSCPACEKEEMFNELRKDKEHDDDEDEKKDDGKTKRKDKKQLAKAARQDKQAGVRKPKKSKRNDASPSSSGSSSSSLSNVGHEYLPSHALDAVANPGSHADGDTDIEFGMGTMTMEEVNRSTATSGTCKDRTMPLMENRLKCLGCSVSVSV